MTVQEALPQSAHTTLRLHSVPIRTRWLDHAVVLFVVLCAVWKFSLPLRSHGALLGYAQDDFYYYLKTAQNMAAGHGSTFDGTTLTNGYHPLYFLLWTAVSHFTSSIHRVFQCLWVLDILSTAVIFLCARTIFSRVTSHAVLRNALALCVLAPCIATISMQMETTVALPLAFALLAVGFVAPTRYTPVRCLGLGVLAACMVLARLDTAFLVLLFVGALFLSREGRSALRLNTVASFLVGTLSVFAYVWINQHYFHTLMPISGQAKELRHGWMPVHDVIVASFAGQSVPQLAFAGVCLCVMVWGWKHLRAEEKQLCLATLLFPLLYYGTEMLVSAWKLWGWYMYALRLSNLGGLVLVCVLLARVPRRNKWTGFVQPERSPWLAPAFLGLACLGLLATRYRIDAVMFEIESAAVRLSSFAGTHPGLYAMGDRAGMFGFLSSSPVLQAEGLMMDTKYLAHIRRQDDLRSTLNNYGVRYYAVFVGKEEVGQSTATPCFGASEPAIAAQDALRMRGTFCEKPVYRFNGKDGEYRVYALQP